MGPTAEQTVHVMSESENGGNGAAVRANRSYFVLLAMIRTDASQIPSVSVSKGTGQGSSAVMFHRSLEGEVWTTKVYLWSLDTKSESENPVIRVAEPSLASTLGS